MNGRQRESLLARWVGAGLIPAETAERIRAWEAEQPGTQGRNWPAVLALAFGAILLAAGILLFVAAHWDELSPWWRFAVVSAAVAALHGAAAAAFERAPLFSTALHATATVSLGGGIALVAQVFHLQVHWPSGVLLWAMGAALGFALLRDWPHATLVAVLTPAWMVSEWLAQAEYGWARDRVISQGLLLLAFVYMAAQVRGAQSTAEAHSRKALSILGTVAIVPMVAYVVQALEQPRRPHQPLAPHGEWVVKAAPDGWSVLALAMALGLVLLIGVALRRRAWVFHLIAALWVAGFNAFDTSQKYPFLGALFWCVLGAALLLAFGVRDRRRHIEKAGLFGSAAGLLSLLIWAHDERDLWVYVACICLSLILVAWGVKGQRRDAINVAVLGFGTTVMFFYFSNVMDKLGRSASLIGLGVLFLAGGWVLERTRRRLLAESGASAS